MTADDPAGSPLSERRSLGTPARLLPIFLAFVVLAGVGLRCALVLTTPPYPKYHEAPFRDEIHYRQLARNLVEFKQFTAIAEGFQTHSTRSPVYPALLALTNWFTGFAPKTHQWLNFGLECINILLIGFLGARLFGPLTGCLALGFYALFGPACNAVTASNPEVLAITLTLASMLSFFWFLRDGLQYRHAWGFALILVLLIHTRPVFLLVTPAVALIIWLAPRQGTWQQRLVPLLLIALLCLPWGIRNYRLHKTIVPVCTMAGWHLATHARSSAELSIETLMDYVYDPAHKNWNEGDFYRDAMRETRRLAMSTPLDSTLTGVGRIIRRWGFPQPYKRIFQARAYVHPVPLGNSDSQLAVGQRPNHRPVLPLFDFEGVCYLAFIFVLGSCIVRSKHLLSRFRCWWRRGWPLVAILSVYIAAHVIGLPLQQYRLIIEPLMVVLMIGLVVQLLGMPGRFRGVHRSLTGRAHLAPALMATVAVLLYAGIFQLQFGTAPAPISYPELSNKTEGAALFSYPQARDMQWQARGNLPTGTPIHAAGVVRHIGPHPDPDLSFQDRPMLRAKLEVHKYADNGQPLGIGDVYVNLPSGEPPVADTCIKVFGEVTVGPFKEITINAAGWSEP